MNESQSKKLLETELKSFVYSVSHDLKGELRELKAILEKKRMDDSNIHFQFQIMEEMFESLGEMSSLLETEIKKETINLSLMATDIFKALQKRDAFNFKVQDSLTVKGDTSLLKRALTALIENSWKFSKNIESPQIEMGKEGDFFYIKDNGPGLPHEEEIFTMFYGKRSKGDLSGIGLGLPLARRVFHIHGGKIWAKNNKGKGSTFYFLIP